MRAIRLLLLLALASAGASCLVVSLHPVYDADTLAFEPGLVGTWTSDEDHVAVTFDRGEWHSYHIALDDDGTVTRVSARLTRVGDLQLLDVEPLDGTELPPLQLAVHTLYRIAIDGDTLTLASLDYDCFFALAKQADTGLRLVLDERKNAVITATTGDYRRWLEAHQADAGLFDDPVALKRKGP